uniref:Secreted protein n=1 Tax=Oryza punctata TaxID=4537 RepID=A0A0E0KQM6_ORYPU
MELITCTPRSPSLQIWWLLVRFGCRSLLAASPPNHGVAAAEIGPTTSYTLMDLPLTSLWAPDQLGLATGERRGGVSR